MPVQKSLKLIEGIMYGILGSVHIHILITDFDSVEFGNE